MWSELDDQRHEGDAHHDYRGRIKSKRCKNRHLHWVYMSDMQTLLASSCSPDCMCTPCLHLHPEPSQLPAKRSHSIQSSHQKFHQKPKKLSLHYYFKNHKFCVFHINTQNFHSLSRSLSLFLLTTLSSKAFMVVINIDRAAGTNCTRTGEWRHPMIYHIHYNTKWIDTVSCHQKFHHTPKKPSMQYYFKNHRFCVFHINPELLSLSWKACILVTESGSNIIPTGLKKGDIP
jgi:hypothetical protein